MPDAIIESCKADVPLFRATTYFDLVIFNIFFQTKTLFVHMLI